MLHHICHAKRNEFNLLDSGLSQNFKKFCLNLPPRETLPVLQNCNWLFSLQKQRSREQQKRHFGGCMNAGRAQILYLASDSYMFAETPYSATGSSQSFKWRQQTQFMILQFRCFLLRQLEICLMWASRIQTLGNVEECVRYVTKLLSSRMTDLRT